MREYRAVEDFENGEDNTFLKVVCEVIRSQDPQNPIYLKSYSGSTEAIVQNLDKLKRLKYRKEIIAYGIKNPETYEEEEATIKEKGEEIIAYGIKNPETSEEEEATIKEKGEEVKVVFHIDFYKILS